MERDTQILADLESIDNGKPMRVARYTAIASTSECAGKLNEAIFRDGDIADSIACLRYYAGWADKIVGQVRIISGRQV